jgi:hypothetical protein
VLYPARLWENLAASIRLAMLDASWINRRLYAASVGAGNLWGRPAAHPLAAPRCCARS